MIIIIYTSASRDDIAQQLGRPEYSYRFVVREFLPLLDRLGTVIEVTDPEREVDAIYLASVQAGEACVFLPFMPPNKVPLGLRCPTIPVFAWEFETIPNEAFSGKPRNDWTRVLRKLGAALTHSSYAVERTIDAMGEPFPIISVPAPLWDRMQALRHAPANPHRLRYDGLMIDSRLVDLSCYRRELVSAALPDALPLPPGCKTTEGCIDLTGVVYTAIFNPYDGRKKWPQMISAFCEALRDKQDATLLIKLTHFDPASMIPKMLEAIHTAGPSACRVVLLHAYLQDADYGALIQNTTYTVSVSGGEGQCLPLMEYMSAGKPAIAPRHTSMRDYVDEDCAFVIDSSLEIGTWPHDQRQAFRTLRHRVHYQSVVDAYKRSHYVATHEPDTYAAMSEAAAKSLKAYCSMAVVQPRLQSFLHRRLSAPAAQNDSQVHLAEG